MKLACRMDPHPPHHYREVRIDMQDELEYPGSRPVLARTHNRSASWTFRSPNTAELSSLASLTNVIREFVPSAFTSEDPMSTTPGTPYDRVPGTAEFEAPVRTYGQASLPGHSRNPSVTGGHGDGEAMHRPAGEGAAEDGNHGNGDSSDGVRWFEENILLILVLLLRFAWMHRLGLVVLLGMFATFLHCNRQIKREISLKDRRNKLFLCLVILFLMGNIYVVYYVFQDQQLQNCLHFSAPFLPLDLWNVLWSICVTDFIIRFGVMVAKATVAATLLWFLPTKRKGKYYMILEYCSQLYRTLVPAPLWFRYLSNYYQTGRLFAVLITAVYLMIKGTQVFARMKQVYIASAAFSKDPNYGCNPSREQILAAGGACPICQEDMNEPIVLMACNHIFCETCIQLWFDRERTCPLCRCVIASDPRWRDGNTDAFIMLF